MNDLIIEKEMFIIFALSFFQQNPTQHIYKKKSKISSRWKQ